jgi:hypothetical protein
MDLMNTSEWRDLENNPLQASEIPAVEIRDNPDIITPHSSGRDFHTMTVMLSFIGSTIAAVRGAIADFEVSIETDRTWGNLAIYSRVISDEIDIRHYEQKYFKAAIPVEIWFVTLKGDPYTKG